MFVNIDFGHLLIILALLALVITALVQTWTSGQSLTYKLIWTVFIVVVPPLGAVVWLVVYIVQRGKGRSIRSGRAS